MVEKAGEIQIQGNKKREKKSLRCPVVWCHWIPEGAACRWLVLSMFLISLPASGSPGDRPERDVVVSREGGQGVHVKCQHHSVLQPVSTVPLLLPRPGAFPVAHMSPWIWLYVSRAWLVSPLPLLSRLDADPASVRFLSLPGWRGGGRPSDIVEGTLSSPPTTGAAWHSWSAPPPCTAERGWGLGGAYCQCCLFLLE